jgi:PAS domain S-box-containing protein
VVLLLDPDGIVVDANKTTASRLGTSREKLIGSCLWEILPPEVAERRKAVADQVLRSGELLRYDDERQGLWYDAVVYPILDEEGRVRQLAVIARDTTDRIRAERELAQYREQLEDLVNERTAELQRINDHLQQEIAERKRVEHALRASEYQYRSLFEQVAVGIGILQEGKLVFVNDALVAMLRYPPGHLFGVDLLDLLYEDYKEQIKKRIALAEQSFMEPSWQEVLCVTGDGGEIWVEARRSDITWKGKPAFLITVREISDHKQRERALEEEKAQLAGENVTLRTTFQDRYKLGEIVGKSPEMQEVYQSIVHAAASKATVILCGETGTGKDLVARTIHTMSTRKDKPFVAVNCGAVPESLFENEFFGHRKGAFTGADRDKPGYFDQAHGGTLFLDEVGELKPSLQVKLLRALEEKTYMPVGETISKTADVRIIAATNRDLQEQLQQGVIRDDFFHRLHVMQIMLPPLRDHKQDIPLLIGYFLEQMGVDDECSPIPGHIMQVLCAYHWPGNVRELQNELQRYLSEQRLALIGNSSPADGKVRPERMSFRETIAAYEQQVIANALEQHAGHLGKTAETLNIPPKTLYRKIRKYQLKTP